MRGAGGGSRRRLPRHLVHEPAAGGRVPLQVQRRARHLPAAARPDRRLLRQSEQDLLHVRRPAARTRNGCRTSSRYFDHATGEVPRPVVLMERPTNDAHCNSVLSLDDAGHVYVFCNAHGSGGAGVRLPQPGAALDWRVRPRARGELLVLAGLAGSRQGAAVASHAVQGRPTADLQLGQRGRAGVVGAGAVDGRRAAAATASAGRTARAWPPRWTSTRSRAG